MEDYEKLGVFYLGKTYDLDKGRLLEELVLYDSKDLTTHAVCVGMTGSGKTGLCLSLLEEAAIDSIPAIAIDPKGDLGNLFLTFPDLKPADFEPWIEPSEATRNGVTATEYAAQMAKRWKQGLAEWGQAPERIGRFRDAVDMAIYTPGSNAGLPLTVLKSFAAPPAAVLEDSDALRERVSVSASGLLALLGINADPVRSREHILVSNIFTQAWQQGRSLDLARLIGEIQSPKFNKVGIVDLESFYPAKERVELAMSLNNLLASPSFASWMEGEPLDVKRLLYSDSGKPRLSILSIAHLSEAERMFFVTILLNEVVAWIRTLPGTSSLRAILYMDEIFGYFPPTANPPTKMPMLTLLKQARAYGLGIVLATQNPVDLDYKGLSNTGTWFLGRLQTERDKARVLDGLEGASAASGSSFDRARIEAVLSGLGNRVFLMNNVHEDQPVVFQSRWALSFLRGPLTRQQISRLMAENNQQNESTGSTATTAAPRTQTIAVAASDAESHPPVLPAGIEAFYLKAEQSLSGAAQLIYRAGLLTKCKTHFVKASFHVDAWQSCALLADVSQEVPKGFWEEADVVDGEALDLDKEPEEGFQFAALPPELSNAKHYAAWTKDLETHLYRNQVLTIYQCEELKAYSNPGETEGEFRVRFRQSARERRDLEVEKLRKNYGTKVASVQKRIKTAEAGVDREKSQAHRAMFDSAISFGGTILGALFGRKTASRTNVSKASTSLRSAGRAAQQKGDVSRAQEKVEDLNAELQKLDQELAEEIKTLEGKFDVESLTLKTLEITPRKSDIEVGHVAVVWTPWQVDAQGIAEPLFTLPKSDSTE